MFTGIGSQAPPPPPSRSRSRAQEARQPRHHLVQQLSTATCTWSVRHLFISVCFKSPKYTLRCFFFYLQGIRQHNPAAYVLNKTGPKHRSPAGPANVSITKSDSLDSPIEPLTVRLTLFLNSMLLFLSLANFCIFIYLMSPLVSDGNCNSKYTEEPLSSHSSQDLQEPGENCQSFRSAGSSQEETGAIYLLCP